MSKENYSIMLPGKKDKKVVQLLKGKQNKTKQWTVSKPTNKFYGPEKAK